MKQKEQFTELYIPDISLEDFDLIEEQHDFSEQYQKNKKKILKEYKKSVVSAVRSRYIKAAIATLIFISASPFVVNAATNGELFNRIWGNKGKNSIETHDELLYDEDKSYTVTYPEREYVEADEEKAQELIGKNVSYETIIEEIDDTTLTILSAVYDGNAAVVEFTLEREGGVNALNYSQLDNEGKGAWFSDEATIWFGFVDCGESIFVDLEKSTEDLLYCYDYIGFDNTRSSLKLEIKEYPCTRGEMEAEEDDEKFDEIVASTKTRSVKIPLQETVSSCEFVNMDGGIILASPISMTIDMKTGLGLSGCNPGEVYYVAVNYKDGSQYLVMEKEYYNYSEDGTGELVHEADIQIDNTSYGLGRLDGCFLLVFNRLVDTKQIDTIIVNNTTYTISQ